MPRVPSLVLSPGLILTVMLSGAASAQEAATQLTTHEAHDYHAKWSPDGRHIAFTSQRSGEPKIHVVPAGKGRFGNNQYTAGTANRGNHGTTNPWRSVGQNKIKISFFCQFFCFLSNKGYQLAGIFLRNAEPGMNHGAKTRL